MSSNTYPEVFEGLIGGQLHQPLSADMEGINTQFSVGFIVICCRLTFENAQIHPAPFTEEADSF
eukprot:2825034-Rhodomonas_salina.1